MKINLKKSIKAVATIGLLIGQFSGFKLANAQTKMTPLGTTAVFGKADNISIEGTVQSPSGEETPLQVICVFEYTEGDIFNSPPALPPSLNGMVHVDSALNGLVTDLRKSGKFAGHAYETLLITPPANTIPAKQLLIIGLGNRHQFTPELMTGVGRIEMREALRLGVDSYAHASDLKDGGIDSPTGEVAQNVVKGALEAYETELYLKGKHASIAKPIKKITLLAGPAFFVPSGDAIKAYLSSRK